MSDKIRFEVETKRVLEILSREIYDSPLALLRENLQNAYDAVLMRCARDNEPLSTGRIEITLDGPALTIQDNGIGMTEDVLRSHFWKTGSSGKHSDLANRAGVVGTFGIGAMANFGIATRLQVTTFSSDASVVLRSTAERDKLSIAEDCIELERLSEPRDQGTNVSVTLQAGSQLSVEQADSYLRSYVSYIPVEVLLNGNLISQKSFGASVRLPAGESSDLGVHDAEAAGFAGRVHVFVSAQSTVHAEVTDLSLNGVSVSGSLVLSQGAGQVMGYRNFFGLAPAPVSGHFQLGGAANLSILSPTAGREALSRESIVQVQHLVNLTENTIAEQLSRTPHADRSVPFQSYVTSQGRYDLCGNVTVEVHPEKEATALSAVIPHCANRNVQYYSGRDPQLVRQFSSPDTALLQISQGNPRRQIQLHYLTQVLKVPEVPDRATVTKEYSPHELSLAEAALCIRLSATLADDYFLPEVEVRFADVTHGVEFQVEGTQKSTLLRIRRGCPSVKSIVECYDSAPEVFSDFVKDFVRNRIYEHVRHLVPSSTQGGADALRKALQVNRELYRYDDTDLGLLEPILSDFLAGDVALGEAIRRARGASRPQPQVVMGGDVGTVEAAIPDVINSPSDSSASDTEPRPAILREDLECPFKILKAEESHPQLEGFMLFLSLSDRLFRREAVFFKSPHTTRVIWGGHRVIYIFETPGRRVTLYYDIELYSPLSEHQAGGQVVPTTTLILKNRLFVPVPEELVCEFEISEGSKQFFVNFDTIP